MPGEHEGGTAIEAPRGADLVLTNAVRRLSTESGVVEDIAVPILGGRGGFTAPRKDPVGLSEWVDQGLRAGHPIYPSESTNKCRTAPTPSKLAERLR